MSANFEPMWLSELRKLSASGDIGINTFRAARITLIEHQEMKARIAELEAQVADYAAMYAPFKAMVDDASNAGEAK